MKYPSFLTTLPWDTKAQETKKEPTDSVNHTKDTILLLNLTKYFDQVKFFL